jgi:hypothetical protein
MPHKGNHNSKIPDKAAEVGARGTGAAARGWEPLSDTGGAAGRTASFNALASVYACCSNFDYPQAVRKPVEEPRQPPFHVKRDHGYAAVHRSIHSRRKRSTSRFT